jgi:hypothetical protein
VERNRFVNVDSVAVTDGAGYVDRDNAVMNVADAVGVALMPALPEDVRGRLPDTLRGALPRARPEAALPRSAIVVDEWGPYDWRSPKLWPVDSTRAVPLRLRVLGPPGRWRVVRARGIVSLSKRQGRIAQLGVGDTIAVTPHADSTGDWELTLEYRGAATVSPTGQRRAAGVPVRFSYGRFEPRVNWAMRIFAWDDATDPRTHAGAFDRLLGGAPLLERRAPRLDLLWYRPAIAGIPPARWALEASGVVDLPPGSYSLRAISDDAVRVWVDGALAIDDWTPHESAVAVAPLGGGRHALRVQYVQIDGWSELRLEILRGAPTSSRGSPGPH